jgi:Rieske Fe-S protein
LLGVVAGDFTGTAVQVAVAGTALAEVGGAVLVESSVGPFLVSRVSDTTFSAVDGVCTHQGCTVTSAEGAAFVCPCHGSRYDRSGHVTGGPAQASLRQYVNQYADGVLRIAL